MLYYNWIKGDEVMKYYCCQDHADLAMEHVIDEQEVAPVIEVVEEQLSTRCSFCEARATYIVTG